MKEWMAVDLFIPREIGESVSNFLMEQGAAGIEETERPEEVGLRVYFPGREGAGDVTAGIHRYLKSLERITSRKISYRLETLSIPEEDWGADWKRYFHPLRVGSRFVIYPPWEKVRLKKGEIPIEINPGMAFGTGTHATTQLCIRALETRLKKGRSILDVGTGSGILAVAAAKLHALEVWALDIDELAIEGAREAAKKNDVADRVRIRKGGLGRVRKRFDVVVANIDFKSLRRLRLLLLRRLNEGGLLILSGILREQEEKVRRRYLETGGLRFLSADRQEEWVCLTFRRTEEKRGIG